MKKLKKIECIFTMVLLCLVGIASAEYVSEPFDAFPGGGTNWTSNWTELAPTFHTLALSTDSPIKGGGSYLVYRTLTGATVGANGLGRDFETSIAEAIHTVKLNVRVDEFGNFFAGPDISDRMQIYGDASTASGDMATYCTWCVMTTATVAHDNWYVYDGIKTGKWSSSYLKDTGLAIVPGGVYSITVKVYPQTLSYDLTMSDGTTTFTKLNNGFRGGPATPADPPLAPGDRIGFGNKVRTAANGGTDCQLSYDSIRVFANGAYTPQPTNGQIQVPVAAPVFSWKTGMSVDSADPNSLTAVTNPAITGHYLYISQPNDPNLAVTPIFVAADADSNGQVDPIASYARPTDLVLNAVYYWRVDESIGATGPTDDPNLVKGAVWSFSAKTTDPIVWAGQNVVSYLAAGTATVNINANVEWFNPQSSILWSVDSQPAGSVVNFSNSAIEDPTVTMDMVGTYVLRLAAQDSQGATGADTMEIHVYEDSCDAAQHVLGYQRIAADLNDDCEVDMDDFAVMASDWLEQNFLLDNYLY